MTTGAGLKPALTRYKPAGFTASSARIRKVLITGAAGDGGVDLIDFFADLIL